MLTTTSRIFILRFFVVQSIGSAPFSLRYQRAGFKGSGKKQVSDPTCLPNLDGITNGRFTLPLDHRHRAQRRRCRVSLCVHTRLFE